MLNIPVKFEIKEGYPISCYPLFLFLPKVFALREQCIEVFNGFNW